MHYNKAFYVYGPVIKMGYMSLNQFLKSIIHTYQVLLITIQAFKNV